MLQSHSYNSIIDLKWVLSQHQTKQFWMFAQGTFFKRFLRKNIGDFTDLHNEKSIWKFRVHRIFSVTGLCVIVYQIFANVAALDPDLVRAAWSGSTLFAYENMIYLILH